MVINQLDNSIKSSKNILLVSHINPDGDTLGSMCAIYCLIKDNYKKKCDMVLVSPLPSVYQFLPYIEEAKHIDEVDLSREYDLVINLDIASSERAASAETLFNKAKSTVNIDHHATNSNYASMNIVESEAAATAEVIYEIAQKLDWKISNDCAVCLYVGIVTDTGGFRFSNTTAKTMEYCAQLLAYGIDPAYIYQKCYEPNSKDMVMFQSYCINKAKFEFDDKIAYTVVYKKDLEKFHNKGEDYTDGLTEKLRAIKTTEIAFVVKELNSTTCKVSMRSKIADVAEICSKFGGGGHKLAAGAVIKAEPQQAVKTIIDAINSADLLNKKNEL